MILTRFAYLPEGTLGLLQLTTGGQVFTVERPWLDNRARVSCIPEGRYALVPHNSARFPMGVIELVAVPDRTAILIHGANRPSELMGCIAPGLDWTIADKATPVVQNSQAALRLVMASFRGGDDVITVGQAAGGFQWH